MEFLEHHQDGTGTKHLKKKTRGATVEGMGGWDGALEQS
jgi:hypothetical protein